MKNRNVALQCIMIALFSITAYAADIDWDSCQYSKSLEFESGTTNYGVSNIYDPGRIIKVYDSLGNKIDEFTLEHGKKKYTALEVGKWYKIDIYACPEKEQQPQEDTPQLKGHGDYCSPEKIDNAFCSSGYICTNQQGVGCQANPSRTDECGCCLSSETWDGYECVPRDQPEENKDSEIEEGKRCSINNNVCVSGTSCVDYTGTSCRDTDEDFCGCCKTGEVWDSSDRNCVVLDYKISVSSGNGEESEDKAEPAEGVQEIKRCTDWDGGSIYMSDEATDGENKFQDYCISEEELVEYICVNNEVREQRIVCPERYMCSYGRCSEKRFCKDSDGQDHYTKGKIEYSGGMENEDKCESTGNLLEYYCIDNSPKAVSVRPPAGYRCEDGRIIQERQVITEKEDIGEQGTDAAEKDINEDETEEEDYTKEKDIPAEEVIIQELPEKNISKKSATITRYIHKETLRINNYTLSAANSFDWARFGVNITSIDVQSGANGHLVIINFKNIGTEEKSFYLLHYIEDADMKVAKGKHLTLKPGEEGKSIYQIRNQKIDSLNPRIHIWEYDTTKWFVDVFFRLSFMLDKETKEENGYKLALAKIEIYLEKYTDMIKAEEYKVDEDGEVIR